MPPVSHSKVWDLEQSFKGILDPNSHWSLGSYLILDPSKPQRKRKMELRLNLILMVHYHPYFQTGHSHLFCHFSLFSFQRWHNYTEMWLLNGPLINLLWISSIFTKAPIIFLILMSVESTLCIYTKYSLQRSASRETRLFYLMPQLIDFNYIWKPGTAESCVFPFFVETVVL